MGGDKGPLITIPSAIMAIKKLPNLHLILCGDENIIATELAKQNFSENPQITILHTTDVV